MDILSTTREIIDQVNLIIEKCIEYREADSVIKATRMRLDGVQVRVELFQEFLKLSESTLLLRRKQILQHSLGNVSDLLHELMSRLPPSPKVSTKLAWVGWGKRRVEGLLEELKTWDGEVQGIIFALDVVSKIRDDDKLYKRLFDTGERTLTTAWTLSKRIFSSDKSILSLAYPLSSIFIQGAFSFSDPRFIAIFNSRPAYVESHYIEHDGKEEVQKRSLAQMAAVFHSPEITLMHLLSCVGLAEDYDFDRCFLVYELPPTFTMHPYNPTLAYILDNQTRISLDDRFRIAVELATAVFEIHAAGWVHKCIRSDNILIDVDDQQGPKVDAKVGAAYLVGFEAARPQIAGSDRCPEMDPIKRKYHHPERQGGRDTLVQKFDIRHDMYSLGAVLIELGYRKTLRNIFGPSSSEGGGDIQKDHERLVGYAKRLGDKMSVKYATAVLTCLVNGTKPGKTTDNLREEFYDGVLRPLKEIQDGFRVCRSFVLRLQVL
ncbi:uncharacterized protein BT62DRAFT_928651 [Guyanagaster necrorhizus]|uniref:Protein kinase domain-containing protein n=1 Tax=Guyanagaster necrorhizus TaxID=856835 RepID=A0A9P7VZM1_9AGAR|nr:uncharacterized protein BT62DRAFT_928651 [Guyanagaster necrorhizus MCA 3950]KAG7449897.1 hypothetical protein BT62DRAFT_928651 [Guyanagaster necrorhizus MCA 3950]